MSQESLTSEQLARNMLHPMPLKHATETFFVFLLGVVIALTGFLTATLPDLPAGALPCGILFVATILYPLSLTRLFRRNRADYPFRWLHWFPAVIVLIWLASGVAAQVYLPVRELPHFYTWGWTLPLVTLGFLGAAIFCIRVIRRRRVRIVLLLVVFVPFVTLAAMSERGRHWDRELASLLWAGEWWNMLDGRLSGSGVEIAMEPLEEASSDRTQDGEPERNLGESEDPAEEAWRERLRAFERRRRMLAMQLAQEEAKSVQAEREEPEGPDEVSAPKTGTGREYMEASSAPSSLPSAGAGVGALGLTMLMTYFGVLHQRAKKRADLLICFNKWWIE